MPGLHFDTYTATICQIVVFWRKNTPVAIKISEALVSKARVYSKVNNRSLTGQIEFWAKIGKRAEENPDLPYDQIKEILSGLEELNEGKGVEFKFG